jgi:hypothetical protein
MHPQPTRTPRDESTAIRTGLAARSRDTISSAAGPARCLRHRCPGRARCQETAILCRTGGTHHACPPVPHRLSWSGPRLGPVPLVLGSSVPGLGRSVLLQGRSVLRPGQPVLLLGPSVLRLGRPVLRVGEPPRREGPTAPRPGPPGPDVGATSESDRATPNRVRRNAEHDRPPGPDESPTDEPQGRSADPLRAQRLRHGRSGPPLLGMPTAPTSRAGSVLKQCYVRDRCDSGGNIGGMGGGKG